MNTIIYPCGGIANPCGVIAGLTDPRPLSILDVLFLASLVAAVMLVAIKLAERR
jgi:hypothetical protein